MYRVEIEWNLVALSKLLFFFRVGGKSQEMVMCKDSIGLPPKPTCRF